jgi:hypothetical protein
VYRCEMMKESFFPVIIQYCLGRKHTIFFTMFRTQPTPDLSVAKLSGLRNTTCLYSKDVASVLIFSVVDPKLIFSDPDPIFRRVLDPDLDPDPT